MKGKFLKSIVAAVTMCLTLTSCDFMSMFSFGSSEEKKDHIYSGHYLFELYEPTQNKNTGVYYAHNDNTLVIDNEERNEAFLFTTNASGGDFLDSRNDVSVTFNIDKGKYRSLCFLAGCAEDRLSHYELNDSCAFSVWFGDTKAYEEMYYALGPSKYVSIDITEAESLTFFISKQFMMRCLGVAEVTLWEDANHSIAPKVEHANKNEDFLDHTYFVYGAGTNGKNSLSSLDDGNEFFNVLDDGETVTVNNQVIDKGVAFTARSWFDENHCQKFAINALGRYDYLHFNLGHIDRSKKDGSVYVRVLVDRVVKLLELITDEDLPHEVTIPLNYGKIVIFEIFPDPDDKVRTEMFSYGSYCLYNFIGSPDKTFPSSGESKTYDGSYKLISQVGKPYRFTNAFDNEESILAGKTAYAGIQMGGVIYSEGLIMKSIFNMLTTTVEQVPARASFDLKGAFKYMTFKVGRKDKTALVSDTLNVYLDGQLAEVYELDSMGCVMEYSLECAGARSLTFELFGTSDTYRGTYGIVDIGVHTDQIRELKFDHVPNGKRAAADNYEKGQRVTLMRDIWPYESFSKSNEQDILTEDRNDLAEYKANDGRSFDVFGETHTEGVVLETGTYMSMGSGAATSAIACMLVGFVLLAPLGARDINCGSLGAFNLREKFATLSFKVAPLQENGKTETLYVINPKGIIDTIELDPSGIVETTVPVSSVSELSFFMPYQDDSSVPFAIYDMELIAK